MLAVVGTIPREEFPVVAGDISLVNGALKIRDEQCPINRGTPALLAAAIVAGKALGQPAPFAYLAGDIGMGRGSRRLYKFLTEHLPEDKCDTMVFHYIQPDVDWHRLLLSAVKGMARRPILIADAGAMYVAKMDGKSGEYDLFTPDVGELAFLADEKAPHPFYTRGFILHDEARAPELIGRAYTYGNAARILLVKGEQDYIANNQGILATINTHNEKAMEAIGGTGDTLTGIVSMLISSGIEIERAAVIAAKANRLAGHYAKPTPASQVMDIISYIPKALSKALEQEKPRDI
jgi:NAD(P)H-hydrate repair Nnr-like enzyme with NAD(P)H-hydrate dehydratase domain